MSTAPLYEDEVIAEAIPDTRALLDETVPETIMPSSTKSGWRKASPIWMLAFVAVAAISSSGTVAPRVEIYTRTICAAHGLDPDADAGYERCRTTPAVQAEAAQLMAVISTLSGLLTTLTAAWWGSLSDCYGRMWVMGFNVGGLLISDCIFLAVAHFWDRLPGTYWCFALGPLIEGMVGGISVASIVMHAYISDCSDPKARSRAFSILMGLLFVGMTIGPLLSGWIMRTTGQLLPVFYTTTALNTLVSLTVWFVMPESLSPAEMAARTEARRELNAGRGRGARGWAKRVGRAVDVFSPLAVLLPQRIEHVHAGILTRTDWTMPMLGAAYGFGTFIQAAIYQQIQYATAVYGWTSDVVSYWLGAIHMAKALWLALLFPGIMQLLGYLWTRRHSTSATVIESEPLLSHTHGDHDHVQHTPAKSPPKKLPVALLDLWMARLAVTLDIVFYALAFVTRSGTFFALFTMGISFGTHFQPTLQSVALDVYGRQGGTDTGRLLGALTVVSALSSHIIGPALFGLIYMKTVETVPGAFYLLQCAALVTSLVLLMLIRLRKERPARPGD